MIVALDIGFGNTKGVTRDKTAVFPSVVAVRSIGLGMAGLGMDVQRTTPVLIGDREFFVGDNAHLWGRVVENLDFSRLTSPEAKALMCAAMYHLLPSPSTSEAINLVIGLPVPLLQSEEAREVLASLKNNVVGKHQARVKRRWIEFTVATVWAVPQPVGAWVDWALDHSGTLIHPEAITETVAIMDIGFNTLDLYGIQGAKAIPRLIGGDKLGVRRLRELAWPGIPSYQIPDQPPPESAILTWLNEITGCLEQIWGNFSFDRLILTGGGANYLRNYLDRFPRWLTRVPVYIPDNPILANARGLWKWGLKKWQGESPGKNADSKSP